MTNTGWKSLWAGSNEHDVGRVLGRDCFFDTIAERWQVNAGEQRLTAAEHDWRDRKVHLVNEPAQQILAHGRDAAAYLHVEVTGRGSRLIKSGFDPFRHE